MRKLEKGEWFILIIYDITNDRRRDRFAECLNGYGYRVQKSCFEAILSRSLYRKLLDEIPKYLDKSEDSVRVYRFGEKSRVTKYGIVENADYEIVGII